MSNETKPKKRTDKERLEWLNWSGAYICHSGDGDSCWLAWYDDDGDYLVQSGSFDNFRDAIDAAMRYHKG